MFDLLFGPLAVWFGVPAVIGTLFFMARLGMSLLGIDFGDGADGDVGAVDMDAPIDEGFDHAESTSVFKFLSLQTITAFAMGFGWGGLLGLKTFELSMLWSLVMGVGVGVAFAWFIVWCFKLMYAMESSGNISLSDALNAEGVAETSIPGNGDGTGRVRLTIRDRHRGFDATTGGDPIQSGTRVKVSRVNKDNTVTVHVI
ncbi:MAG: hypothetical protein AAF432_02860 [Planctomycetota bacterium]